MGEKFFALIFSCVALGAIIGGVVYAIQYSIYSVGESQWAADTQQRDELVGEKKTVGLMKCPKSWIPTPPVL
jgi:hypothetical protein